LHATQRARARGAQESLRAWRGVPLRWEKTECRYPIGTKGNTSASGASPAEPADAAWRPGAAVAVSEPHVRRID